MKAEIVARDETEYWNKDTLQKADLYAAFGIYVLIKGEQTFCCEMSPSSYNEFLRNEFVYDCDDEKAHEAAGDLMFEGAQDSSHYSSYFTPSDDRFFLEDSVEIDEDDLEGLDEDESHALIWEKVMEAASQDHDTPAILDLATWGAWQREKMLKRRATNYPPVANWGVNGLTNLPLFTNAVNKLQAELKPALDRLERMKGQTAAYCAFKKRLKRERLHWDW